MVGSAADVGLQDQNQLNPKCQCWTGEDGNIRHVNIIINIWTEQQRFVLPLDISPSASEPVSQTACVCVCV